MDFPSKEELIANRFDNVEKIREHLGVDSLEYMTEDELLESMVDHEPSEFCTACFTGKYPIPIKDLELINLVDTEDEVIHILDSFYKESDFSPNF